MPEPANADIRAQNAGRTCLVTGGSAGIGAALAREFAAKGWDIALTARRKAPMQALAKTLKDTYGVKVHVIVADLADPNGCQTIIAASKRKKLTIDGLVNNAGYGVTGTYLESDWQTHKDFLSVMLEAPCELSHYYAAGMKERGFGRIMNVASLAGHIPGSRGHTLYAADKSFLIKFSQSLNLELASYGVHVSALCPGFTYSEFHDVNGTRTSVGKLPDFMWMEADDVARRGFAALERNDPVHITGRINRIIAIFVRLLPESLALSLMRKNSERVRKG